MAADVDGGSSFPCGPRLERARAELVTHRGGPGDASPPRPAALVEPHGIGSPTDLRVVACPHPFSAARVDLVVPHGDTIAEILATTGVKPGAHAHVFVDDWQIAPEWWRHTRPRRGSTITIRVVPSGGRGGGGGGGGKDATRIGLVIAVAALAVAVPYLAPAAWGLTTAAGGLSLLGGLVSAGVGVVGTLNVGVVAPSPEGR